MAPTRKDDKDEEEYNHGHFTRLLLLCAIASVVGSSVPHGFNSGVLNAPGGIIRRFYAHSYFGRYADPPACNDSNSTVFTSASTIDGYELNNMTLSDHARNIYDNDEDCYERALSVGFKDFLWAFTNGIYLFGGVWGSYMGPKTSDRFGRKKALLFHHIPSLIGTAMLAFANTANSFELIIIGRFVVGYACGAGSGMVPMYLTEISPVNLRGALGTLHQLGLTIGIFTSQILGLTHVFGTEELWPVLLGFQVVLSIIGLIALPFCPESPKYSYVKLGNREQAIRDLQRIHNSSNNAFYIKEFEKEERILKKTPNWTLWKVLTSKAIRSRLIVLCFISIAQQLTGINVVFYYSGDVFKGAGVPKNGIQYATLATGFINVLMTVISVPLMDRRGRRPLLLYGMIGMILSNIVITISLSLQERIPAMAWLSVVCMFTFVITFAIGLGPIPQFLGGELFKQGPRATAMGFSGFLNWTCNFLVAICFPFLQRALDKYSFIVFLTLAIFFAGFVYKFFIETKKKSNDEIEVLYGGDNDDEEASDDDEEELSGPEGSRKDDYRSVPTRDPNEIPLKSLRGSK